MSVSQQAARPSAAESPSAPRGGALRAIGLGLITGAADDDPSAIGTYATAGATLGPSFLWAAPATFPMMFAVVYLSGKLGQVAGEGLFAHTLGGDLTVQGDAFGGTICGTLRHPAVPAPR